MTFAPFAPKSAREAKSYVRISEAISEASAWEFVPMPEASNRNFAPIIQSLGADVSADSAHIRKDLAGLRGDIQALAVRMARIEGFLVGYFAARSPRDHHDTAA